MAKGNWSLIADNVVYIEHFLKVFILMKCILTKLSFESNYNGRRKHFY
jgi:hypothetical protein